MNAPTASARPICSASTAEPTTRSSATSVKSSRDCTRAARSRRRGSAKRATTARSSARPRARATSSATRPADVSLAAGEDRHREQERHDAEVLEQQDPDRELAVRRVDLAALREQPDHERRARHRHERADHERAAPGRAEPDRRGGHERERDRHLEAARRERDAPEPRSAVDRQLEADLEQQEDDAELGEVPHALRIGDEPESARPDQRADREEARDRRQPQPLEERDPGRREREDEQQLDEKAALHLPLRASGQHTRRARGARPD